LKKGTKKKVRSYAGETDYGGGGKVGRAIGWSLGATDSRKDRGLDKRKPMQEAMEVSTGSIGGGKGGERRMNDALKSGGMA